MATTDPHPTPVNIQSMLRGQARGDRRSELPADVKLLPAQGDTAVALPRIAVPAPLRLLRVRQLIGPALVGQLALVVLVAATVLVVAVASGAPSVLVQGSLRLFPPWLAGPLHGPLSGLLEARQGKPVLAWPTVDYGLSIVIVVMLVAYAVAVLSARKLSMRAIAVAVAVLYAFLVLSPPLELTDVFNYLGYARLEGLHGLNPYTHVIADEHFDPVYLFATWRNYHSPYGQVFSLLTYPLGGLSLGASYWVLKVGMVLLMGGFVWLVARCARQLGHDPRFAVVFVALNPLVLIYDAGGFHNDPVMLVPMMGALSLLLSRRFRWAGAMLALAAGVKITILLLLPFMMLAARPQRRSLQVLLGAALGAIPLAAVSVAAYGPHMPNVSDQSIIVTPLSVVNLVGVLFHLGGASPIVEQVSKVALVLVTGLILAAAVLRRRPDWLSGAGWATLALLLCTSWLMPWYIVWALPLVALSTSRRLRAAMTVFIAYAAITFLPWTALTLHHNHLSLMKSHADQVAIWRLWNFQRGR